MKINKKISIKGIYIKAIKNNTFIHQQKNQKMNLLFEPNNAGLKKLSILSEQTAAAVL
jgi:hypothetical protein